MNTLTAAHYRAQLAIRAELLKRVAAIWPSFDITDIDRSWRAIQQSLTAVVWMGHQQSSAMAGGYYQALREYEGIPGAAPVRYAPLPSIDYLDRVFTYTGLIVPKKLVAAGRQDAAQQTLVHVLGTVGRLALNGGRDTILETTNADPAARGWERVVGGNACDFCEMLADRGVVYSEATADFAAHDHCSCSAAPAFSDGTRGDTRSVQSEFTPSDRQFTPEQRAVRNERVRQFIADNG